MSRKWNSASGLFCLRYPTILRASKTACCRATWAVVGRGLPSTPAKLEQSPRANTLSSSLLCNVGLTTICPRWLKPSALRIERMLEKIEAKLVPPERKCLCAIIHEGDAEAVVKEKKEKALAEHVARHPEDAGRTVRDFRWIVRLIVRHPQP